MTFKRLKRLIEIKEEQLQLERAIFKINLNLLNKKNKRLLEKEFCKEEYIYLWGLF